MIPIICSSPAIARFQPDDSNEIDQEEKLTRETFIDIKSYGFPTEWDSSWLNKPVGFRATAGSLNMDYFYYFEQLKLISTAEWGGLFSFTQDREEDLLFMSRQAEVRLGWQHSSGFYGGMAGEGGYFKKWGDVGWYAGFGNPENDHIDICYYSVDHYYNEKEPGPNRYTRRPWTVAADGQFVASNRRSFLKAHAFYDSPLRWEQDLLDLAYAYRKSGGRVFAGIETSPKTQLIMKSEFTSKLEEKQFKGSRSDKTMERWNYQIDLSLLVESGEEGSRFQPGAIVLQRHADYRYSRPNLPDPETEDRLASPDSMRKEVIPYFQARTPLGRSPTRALVYGPIWSYGETIQNNSTKYFNEVKLQGGLEVDWTSHVRVLFNTNWDIDNITTDYPYKKKSFRPWDGGNLQIQAVF